MTATEPPLLFPAAAFPAVPDVVPATHGLWGEGGAYQWYDARLRWVRKAIRTARRQRLLAVAFTGRAIPAYEAHHPDDRRPRTAIEVAERFADGRATRRELDAASKEAWAAARAAAFASAAAAAAAAAFAAFAAAADVAYAAAAATIDHPAERLAQLRVARLWTPVTGWDAAYETADARGLAEAIYRGRAWERMPILADALDDAGYAGEPWLTAAMRHPGAPWGRGCWVVDRLMGRV